MAQPLTVVEPAAPDAAGTPRRRADRNLEAHYAAGLRNHWYAVYESRLVGREPVAVRRLGEDLVLWRDAAGSIHVFRDYCPHRGAMLSAGFVDGDAIRCRYHGWLFDGGGRCVDIPARGGDCALAQRTTARSYPAEEHGGLVFAYMSSDGRAPHGPPPIPEELTSPDWNGFIDVYDWPDICWLRLLDNVTDPLHGTFLHAGTYTLGRGTRTNVEMVLEDLADGGDGFLVARKGERGRDLDAIEYHFPNWVRTNVPYPWSAGPGGPMRILGFITPIDADGVVTYWRRQRPITGWKWWLWRALWHLRLKKKADQVVDQDEVMLRTQRNLEARRDEVLDQSDVGVARTRSMLAREWRRQAGEADGD
jgi:phenylpropionate dioxygenase-like ring-hydroxylating dioxygenase large terminal subunit